jgi:hypothetical protein
MAGAPPITNQSLGMILDQHVAKSLNRAAAAALTMAFAVLKADRLSRGEKVSDEDLKNEVRVVFRDLLGETDPSVGQALAQRQRP